MMGIMNPSIYCVKFEMNYMHNNTLHAYAHNRKKTNKLNK